uniref:Uncharacterized protein n=1 Tax=Toxoplasma gondii COUG TaxID=1074873 RepID=A0A2G8Y9U8_TOXGO|nr:hypothetical protein TGCOUG_225905 [Toxoplasma gondii COUG]
MHSTPNNPLQSFSRKVFPGQVWSSILSDSAKTRLAAVRVRLRDWCQFSTAKKPFLVEIRAQIESLSRRGPREKRRGYSRATHNTREESSPGGHFTFSKVFPRPPTGRFSHGVQQVFLGDKPQSPESLPRNFS